MDKSENKGICRIQIMRRRFFCPILFFLVFFIYFSLSYKVISFLLSILMHIKLSIFYSYSLPLSSANSFLSCIILLLSYIYFTTLPLDFFLSHHGPLLLLCTYIYRCLFKSNSICGKRQFLSSQVWFISLAMAISSSTLPANVIIAFFLITH